MKKMMKKRLGVHVCVGGGIGVGQMMQFPISTLYFLLDPVLCCI